MSQFSHIYEIHVPCPKSNKEAILGDLVETPLPERNKACSDIRMNNINAPASRSGRASSVFPASGAPYWITPVVSGAAMAVYPADSSQLTLSMNFVNSTSHEHANSIFNIIDYSKLFRTVRILGLMSVISYMTVILFTWVYANLTGYVYFSAGEPVLLIKYPEWALGLIGISVAIDCLRKELDALCEIRVFSKKI
ncbi:Uncharacterised protein [uncultured archaeon]|nr:Uncharacterised protein [uncultured archaeon]